MTTNLAKHDSASMKTIAVVTLAFLPATFVCVSILSTPASSSTTVNAKLEMQTIFSMSFFTLNVDGNTGEKHWLISDRFWIYCKLLPPKSVLRWLERRISGDGTAPKPSDTDKK